MYSSTSKQIFPVIVSNEESYIPKKYSNKFALERSRNCGEIWKILTKNLALVRIRYVSSHSKIVWISLRSFWQLHFTQYLKFLGI